MQSLPWYINRLGRMSPTEMAWRAGKLARSVVDRLADRLALDEPSVRVPQPAARTPRFIHVPPGLAASTYEKRVEQIVKSGLYSLFNLPSCRLGTPPDWNRDPLSGRLAPLSRAATLDYRDEALVGDIKYLWEPNRHLHLVHLAQAYALSNNEEYAREVERQIDSWIAQCPVGRGPNWASSLELGIRLINWSLTWQLLGAERSPLFAGARGNKFRERWLRSIFHHARMIVNNFSRFSSANNHLIGEAAGVWIASTTWPHLRQLPAWGARSRKILATQMFAQNAPDGGNREQAIAYQQFVLDFLLLSGLAARATDNDFSAAWWQQLEKMIGFLASLMDVAGHVPMIGDADDGYAVSLSAEPDFCPYRSLIATGAVLFARADFATKARRLDDKTKWLLGGQADQAFGQVARSEYRPERAFPDSGYYLLGEQFETAEEVRLLVDAGPLGFLSLAAHGHADALAVVLNVGGREVLIDPGTYAYHTQPEWRRYFRSTAAHNALTVDDEDQSRQGGNFMWSRHAKARRLEFFAGPERQRFVGEHDGYMSLQDPVMHRRSIVYDEVRRVFEIEDAIECHAAHRVSRRWHFAESLAPLVADNGGIEVRAGSFVIKLLPLEKPDRVQVVRAGSATQGGWVSRRFGCKSPCTTVEWVSDISGPTVHRTRIEILPDAREWPNPLRTNSSHAPW